MGEDFYTITQTGGTYFSKQYKEFQQKKEINNVRKVFPDCRKATEKKKTNATIKTGKYEGFWVGADGGYSNLTLRSDGSFTIKTNVNHSNHTIISTTSFEGSYVVYKNKVIYPDDSTGYSTFIIHYFGDYILAQYEADTDYFGDQSSGYEYVG